MYLGWIAQIARVFRNGGSNPPLTFPSFGEQHIWGFLHSPVTFFLLWHSKVQILTHAIIQCGGGIGRRNADERDR